jgi:acyl-CoA reductase-like NAD-dependent aldehyde dehydrogenase
MDSATFLHFSGNRFIASQSERYFDKRLPVVDGSLVGIVVEGAEQEVKLAVRAAHDALAGPWAALTLSQRTTLLHGIAAEIGRRIDDFLEAEVDDCSAGISSARRSGAHRRPWKSSPCRSLSVGVTHVTGDAVH